MDVAARTTEFECMGDIDGQKLREDWIDHVMRKFFYCCISAPEAASLTGMSEDDIWKHYLEWRGEEGKCIHSEFEERVIWAFRRHGSDKKNVAIELNVSVRDVETILEAFPRARAGRTLGNLEKQSRHRFCEDLDSW